MGYVILGAPIWQAHGRGLRVLNCVVRFCIVEGLK